MISYFQMDGTGSNSHEELRDLKTILFPSQSVLLFEKKSIYLSRIYLCTPDNELLTTLLSRHKVTQ